MCKDSTANLLIMLQGSTFHVLLPKVIGSEKTKWEDKMAKIMIVDDESAITDAVAIRLEANGYEVIKSCSGQECLQRLREESVVLILLDIMMPEMDGWEVLDKLKEDDKNRSIPVIVLSAKDQPIDKHLGLSIYGVKDYISKPFDKDNLIERIQKVIGK